MSRKKKVRVELRKNRGNPPRDKGLTRGFDHEHFDEDATLRDERVRAKGELSRYRTIVQDEADVGGAAMPAADTVQTRPGRVIRIHNLIGVVEAEDGRLYRCAVRRLLRSLTTDERNIIATGDRVWFRLVEGAGTVAAGDDLPAGQTVDGWIERVEPRHGVLTRESRRREHVLVANVDQLVIVMSLFEPDLKPHLIDRYLASAEKGGLSPVVCLNKADLANARAFQPLIGAYQQLGVPTILASAVTGVGIDRLREQMAGRATVFSGQSGVGKSSLLNALQPGLRLRVAAVSDVNQKGKHTTTTAELLRLDFGGWVVDTPGVRQLQLWDTLPEEVEGYLPEFRPFVTLCSFPDCTHTHEDGCAVKRAVRRRQISGRRYHSYLGMFTGASEG
jgi:ribosome biogenesis GTPase